MTAQANSMGVSGWSTDVPTICGVLAATTARPAAGSFYAAPSEDPAPKPK